MRRTSDFRLVVNGRPVVLTRDEQNTATEACIVSETDNGGEVHVETPNGLFSVDAVCAAAFCHASAHDLHGRCVVMTKCSGFTGNVPVVAEPDDCKATAVLPVPSVERKCDVLFVGFPGVLCAVSLSDQPTTDAMLFVHRDPNCEKIRVFFREEQDWIELPASGLAAAAAAVDLASTLADGVIEYGIGMQSGTAEVGVSKRDGVLAGLSVCCTVSVEGNE